MENAMGYVILIVAIAVIGELIGVAFQWRKLENRSKVVLGIAVPVQLFGIIVLFLSSWGIFPWGRAGAFATADRFLATMKRGNYLEATQYMQPCVRDFVGLEVLGTPEETRPISWQWTGYESNGSFASTIGTAKFIDNAELRMEIELSWNGYKWELYGVTFGEPHKNPRVHFSWGC
jgi:hypothetical protein